MTFAIGFACGMVLGGFVTLAFLSFWSEP